MKRFASAVILVAVAVVLYRKAIRLWWTFDDPANLHFTLTHAFGDTVRAPQPFLLATYHLLTRFIGVDPAPWYRVQLSLIVVAAIAVFLTLRLFVEWIPALCGAILFVTGPPLCIAATQLRTMHALEAIVLVCAAVATYVIAFRRQSFAWEIASAALYFIAMIANELAIPLPLVLLFIADKPLRVRVRHLLMHAIALMVFLVWRRPPLDFGAISWDVVTAITGDGLFFGVIALAVLAIGVAIALRSRRGFAITVAGFGAVLLALISGADDAFAAWLWLSVAFTLGAASLTISPRVALFVIGMATVVVANRQEWTAEYTRTKRMSDEARTFIAMDGASLLRKPSIPPDTLAELRWLKESYFRRAIGTGWFYDDLFLCTHFLRGRHIYEYNGLMKQVVEVTARIPDFAREYCGDIRDDVPLRAEFHHRHDKLTWRLGPYATGQYHVLLAEGVQAFAVERDDARRFDGVRSLSLRIRYDSPEGWVTYSPEIVLDFATQPDFTWHR